MSNQKIELTEEMKSAIDNYGTRVKTLKDFVTAVRKRPGYHIGYISNKGFKNQGREIFQNAVDQILEPMTSCTTVNFFYDERTLEVIVEDIGGLGIPFDDMIRIYSTPNTSKNYEKRPGEYSSGMHGAGGKVTNALSEVFIVESYKYDGTAARVEFRKGYPVSKDYKKIPNKEHKQGTKVSFIPDLDIMGNVDLPWKEFYILIKRIISQTPIGSTVNFTAIDKAGNKFTEAIINKDGIITDLIMKVKKPIIKPIVIGADDGYHKLECAFCYDAGDEQNGPDDRESVTAFSNFCETVGGTHIEGTLDGISRWFCNYMNNIFLANQKSKVKLKITPVDVKTGLNVMISAAALEAVFTGQAKDILSNEDMIPFCKNTVMKGLDEWSKANPQDLAKLSRFFKDIGELRQKAEAGKAKIVTKYQANVLTGLPAKYIRPTQKPGPDTELIIIEGDSAAGTVMEGRDPKTQGKNMPHIVVIQCA